MSSEKFVSGSLSRKRFQNILDLFHASEMTLGNPRNTIKVVNFENKKLVVKSFRSPNLINKLVYRFFRPSKAQRSYENAKYLIENGIGTPAPLGYLEKMTAVEFQESYYISDYVEHDFTYREIINDEELTDKEKILIHFTRFIFKLHEANIYFLDNSPGNTLISKTAGSYDFYLVDLNRMKFYDIPFEDRLKNFERLSPEKWMYDIMGAEYASLMDKDSETTIDAMWSYTQKFQEKFHKKKRLKKKVRELMGKS
ncbi:lipopolysaccharide kinase InaA family protein [Nonlabens antarcticus]|uniref:lipopolysaccharide kinase InaA family protein n=1 Tax=Nonlabens antarcticus TaxID=392714 RepID=UPI0018917CF9|nr:lipopolysaccharide kinase InaA family protein [Nonlabens antarcticus]